VKLSVIIPAHNEVDSIGETLRSTVRELERAAIEHELIVIDDASTDGTGELVAGIEREHPTVRCVRSRMPPGFGHAVRCGLELYRGDAVAIMMADLSDCPRDLVRYHRMLEQGYDCVFGTRFGQGGRTYDYPPFKLVLNRIVNLGIRLLFRHGYNDTTNAFKAYRREVIDQIQPLLSNHFNLTVEMPLKAIVRGYDFAVVPISWRNRRHGTSKLRLQEMGSRYAFIVLYVWLEHHLSRGDYRRRDRERPGRASGAPVAGPGGGERAASRAGRRAA
jgi:dolichol-phosphate mannosyltransferase